MPGHKTQGSLLAGGIMPDAVAERVVKAIAAVKKIPVERVSPGHSLEELGVDSLDTVTMVFDLEEAFKISIPDDKVRSVRTVQDIIDGIHAALAPQPESEAASAVSGN